jgi:tetratricopeptide (TPR) repeat protein
MNVFVTILGLAGFCFVMWDFSQHMPLNQRGPLRRWFRDWTIKGLLVPVLLWMLFNSAAADWFPPLLPMVDFAIMNGQRSDAMMYVGTLGLFVIGTYWAAVTLGWVLAVLWRQTSEPRQFRACVLLWSAFLAPLGVLITWSFGWRLAGLGATLWLLPIVQQVLALQAEEKTAPLYSRAIAAIHFDKYEEAEKAVLAELESCEEDFEGWLMLADLYANHFNDLPGAEKLIRETCGHPSTNASQFAVAFHRLADWRLKLARDPCAARAALEEISRRHPNSHLDRMARLRASRLPASREELIARESVKTIILPVRQRAFDDSVAVPDTRMSRQEAVARSQQCIERLQNDPDDIAARENLARLYAEGLEHVDMGLEQLALLLEMPDAPPSKAAEWLALMASWHLQDPQGQSAAHDVMERLIGLYPQTPQAFTAQRRLNLMKIEAKMRQAAGTRQEHAW